MPHVFYRICCSSSDVWDLMDVAGDSRKYHTIFSYRLTLVGCVLGHWPGMQSWSEFGNNLIDGAVRGGYLVQTAHSNIRQLLNDAMFILATASELELDIYNSVLSLSSLTKKLRRMLLRVVRSSIFSCANPPFFNRPASLVCSFVAYSGLAPSFDNARK